MSLFYIDESDELNEMVQHMSRRQYAQSPGLYDNLPERARKAMKRDFFYAISYLKLSVDLKEEQVFLSYVRWTCEYLSHLMTYMSGQRMHAQIRDFYVAMDACIQEELPPEQYDLASAYLRRALEEIDRLFREGFHTTAPLGSKPLYEEKIKEYIAIVLRKDSKAAMSFFLKLYEGGMGIREIYLELAEKIMLRIGQLWFENKISVAQEHYCTALTQTAIAQLYGVIFSTPPNGYTMIGCCIGGELHEMGMRMITDLFAYEGWNSVFLGAGVPEEGLLSAVKEEKPHLVALSVTMPQNLILCRSVIRSLRGNIPDLKIAIGGRAFDDLPDVWKKWGADVYTTGAEELIQWAKVNIQ